MKDVKIQPTKPMEFHLFTSREANPIFLKENQSLTVEPNISDTFIEILKKANKNAKGTISVVDSRGKETACKFDLPPDS